MFLEFLYALRAEGLGVTTHDWLALMAALGRGLHGQSLQGFYQVARCLLVHKESDYDGFDRAFLRCFEGVEATAAEILEGLEDWLRDPKNLERSDPRLRAALDGLDPQTLRRQFFERLREQRSRHEGGSRWIGTGGTSPFGQGGMHPTGVRVGGVGGGRSALAVADARRFAAYRKDVVLDTRQIGAALRRLRRLGHHGRPDELDLEGTIAETARNCGDLEIVMRPPRDNRLRVLLLLDVGGSMTPHARLVERLFSAAHTCGGFASLESYYFHNCVYGQVFRDADFLAPVATAELLERMDGEWRLIVVGDAYMHPMELELQSGSFWAPARGPSGYTWLARLADRFARHAWLNPEPRRLWRAPSIRAIRALFPMFPLTLAGLEDMIAHLGRPPSARHRAHVHQVARDVA